MARILRFDDHHNASVYQKLPPTSRNSVRRPSSLIILVWVVTMEFLLFSVLLASKVFQGAASSSQNWDPCRPEDQSHYLDLSDEELYETAVAGRIGDYCYIQTAPAACNLYVKARPSNSTRYSGWPRSWDDRGTGCVKDSSHAHCYFEDDDYKNWHPKVREEMCTDSGTHNAAAQLRHAILHRACSDDCPVQPATAHIADEEEVDMEVPIKPALPKGFIHLIVFVVLVILLRQYMSTFHRERRRKHQLQWRNLFNRFRKRQRSMSEESTSLVMEVS